MPGASPKYWWSPKPEVLAKLRSLPNLGVIPCNLPGSASPSLAERHCAICSCEMQSFWPITGSRMAVLFSNPPVPYRRQTPGLEIRNTGIPKGAGAMKEQGTWLGCAGKGEVGPSKYLVTFFLFKFEAGCMTVQQHSFCYTFASENNCFKNWHTNFRNFERGNKSLLRTSLPLKKKKGYL